MAFLLSWHENGDENGAAVAGVGRGPTEVFPVAVNPANGA
jgi:hypothetical protein